MFTIGNKVKVIGSSCAPSQCRYCAARIGNIATIKRLTKEHAYLDDEADPIEYKYLELVRNNIQLPLPG